MTTIPRRPTEVPTGRHEAPSLRCLFIIACLTVAVVGCGSHTSVPAPMAATKIAAGHGFQLGPEEQTAASGPGATTTRPARPGQRRQPNKAQSCPGAGRHADDWEPVASNSDYGLALQARWQPLGLVAVPPAPIGAAQVAPDYSHDWAAIADRQSLALKKDGTSGLGRLRRPLGLGVPSRRLAPPLGSDNDWAAISCGYNYSLALKNDGTSGPGARTTASRPGRQQGQTCPTRIGQRHDWAAIAPSGTTAWP